MIWEFEIHSTELSLTPNADGTHSLRVVQEGARVLEFTCQLEPHLVARVEIDDSTDTYRIFTWAGKEIVSKRGPLDLSLRVDGKIKPDADGDDLRVNVLHRDGCGQPLNRSPGRSESDGDPPRDRVTRGEV